jgi:hypothetical protein
MPYDLIRPKSLSLVLVSGLLPASSTTARPSRWRHCLAKPLPGPAIYWHYWR